MDLDPEDAERLGSIMRQAELRATLLCWTKEDARDNLLRLAVLLGCVIAKVEEYGGVEREMAGEVAETMINTGRSYKHG